jgi:hypothetical protein
MWSVFDFDPLLLISLICTFLPLLKKKEKDILETLDRICEWDSYTSYYHFRASDYKPESVKMPETRERERNRRRCRQRATIAYRPFFFFFFLLFFFIFFFGLDFRPGPCFFHFSVRGVCVRSCVRFCLGSHSTLLAKTKKLSSFFPPASFLVVLPCTPVRVLLCSSSSFLDSFFLYV